MAKLVSTKRFTTKGGNVHYVPNKSHTGLVSDDSLDADPAYVKNKQGGKH